MCRVRDLDDPQSTEEPVDNQNSLGIDENEALLGGTLSMWRYKFGLNYLKPVSISAIYCCQIIISICKNASTPSNMTRYLLVYSGIPYYLQISPTISR